MIPYFGDYPTSATVYIPINTFDSNDPAASVTVTNLLNTDVHIHKDGGTTQRNNAAGITMTIDYDSITGNHLLIIDTSDNTVADFYQAGHEYQVRVEGITVDSGTLNAWVGCFSIERAGGVLALIKAGTTIQGNCNAALVALNLDHLCKVDTTVAADGDLSDYVVDGTILSHIMTAGADTSDYAASTDSLEAIQATSAVQSVLETNNLDHLCKTTTGVAADGDLSDYVVDGTILSHVMTAGADTSDYMASTDSLEAVRDHIGNGANLTEAGGDGDHLTAINLPNQTMDITGNITGNLSGSVGSLTGHTVQTGDSYAIVSHADYGNAKLVRSTTPANTLDVSATGEAGLDFDNIKDATGAHTLANITVPTTTSVTNRVTANTDQIEGSDATDQIESAGSAAIDNAISSPTAGSLGWWAQWIGQNVVTKMIITEATGACELYDRSNSSLGTVPARFVTDGTYTTRLLGVV